MLAMAEVNGTKIMLNEYVWLEIFNYLDAESLKSLCRTSKM